MAVLTVDEGACSTPPALDPQRWLADWTAIGGGFARTANGLCLFWADVQDRQARNRLLANAAPPAASEALLAHLDGGHVVEAL